MKKAIFCYCLGVFILLLSACDDNALNSTNDSENLIKTETQKKAGETTIIVPLRDEPIYLGDDEAIEKAKAIPINEWEGPFQVSVSRIVRYPDFQHFIDYVPDLATALYWCDFLIFQATASIPAGAVAHVEDPTPTGWTSFDDGLPGMPGITIQQSTTGDIQIETHTIHIKHNIAGESIDMEYPHELSDGFEYTYYYIEP